MKPRLLAPRDNWISQGRERKGWTRFELARQSGVHPSQLGLIENGRLVALPAHLERIAEALGVPIPDEALETRETAA